MPAKKPEPKFKVGDKVIVFRDNWNRGRNAEPNVDERTVSRVGRQYVYVGEQSWNERAFEIGTGFEKVTWGDASRLFTLEEYEDFKVRQEAVKTIRASGFLKIDSYRGDEAFTTLQLERIAAIVSEGK